MKTTKTLQTFITESVVDEITIDSQTTESGEHLLTFINKSLAGTRFESTTVTQMKGEQIEALKAFINSL